MPDYSQDSVDAAKNKLASFGSLVGAFNQGTYRTQLAAKKLDKIGDKSLGSGYRSVVSLDWIRRVLHSKANRDPSYLNYSYDALSKDEASKKHPIDQLQRKGARYHAPHGPSMYRQTWEGLD